MRTLTGNWVNEREQELGYSLPFVCASDYVLRWDPYHRIVGVRMGLHHAEDYIRDADRMYQFDLVSLIARQQCEALRRNQLENPTR